MRNNIALKTQLLISSDRGIKSQFHNSLGLSRSRAPENALSISSHLKNRMYHIKQELGRKQSTHKRVKKIVNIPFYGYNIKIELGGHSNVRS